VARRRRRGWLALLLVLVLTTAAALAGWYYTEGRYTTAPPLQSMTRTQAETVARTAGLDVVFQPAFSESAPPGTVIATRPGAGEKVLSGGQVTALVSSGPERHQVPRLTGLPRAQAEEAVARSSLTMGAVTKAYSETVATGQVIASSPAAGVLLRRQAAVGLTVSDGPRPIPVVSYVKSGAARAKAALKKAGFTVRVTTKHSKTVAVGKVISQRPDSGTGHRGDRVVLAKSLGPVMVPVPNVTKMGVRAAEKLLRSGGFRVTTRPVSVNYLGLGVAAYTTPRARHKAPEGSRITLYVV
jgi:serine/threonine-protein kinase